MIDERVIESAIEYVKELFAGNAGGHDAAHTLRVYRNAMAIAEREARGRGAIADGLRDDKAVREARGAQIAEPCDAGVVALAALLHDADDYKLFHTENNENARGFMERSGLTADEIEAVCTAINAVSFSKNRGRRPETPEGRIVQDADRLDAIGAVGIARTFSFGGEQGRDMDESVQHFYDKLLLLKDMMNTDAAREMAATRHAFMEAFLKELRAETEPPRQCYAYILKCADGTYYTGWTTDPERRARVHNSGKGAKYTRARRPVELVYCEAFADKVAAQRREWAIKQLTRAEKEELIKSTNNNLWSMEASDE